MSDQDDILSALHAILDILERIEKRQIKTTAMVAEVEAAKTPVVGSFGTTEEPER